MRAASRRDSLTDGSLIDGGIGGVLDRRRTPAEPGPGPISSESLRVLDLVVGRRVDAALSGEYRSPFTGLGSEFQQVRPYQPGDDVRRIDWNVTARTGEPHVRVELADRVLVTWLVIDSSASMRFGTADRRKADVAEGVAIAVGHVATRHGNRLGVITFGDGQPHFQQPREGRRGLLLALEALPATPTGSATLADALTLLTGLAAPQRSLIVVVSDFRGPATWERSLGVLAARHAVLAIEIRDPREQELPDLGELRLVDPETGERLVVDTDDPELRTLFAEEASAERQVLASQLSSAGVPLLTLSTRGDWFRPLVLYLRRPTRR